MSVVICPLFEGSYYTYTIDLSKETYSLTFRWNSRLQQFLLDIDDAENNTLVQGVSLVDSYPLIRQYALEKPIGEFFLLPLKIDSKDEVDPRNTHKTHFLVYDDEF